MVDGWGEHTPAEANTGEGWGSQPTEAVAASSVTYEVKYVSQPDTEDPEAFRLRRNAEIDAWLKSKPALEFAKTNEMDLRKRVSGTLFPNPKKGTQRYDLGNGYKVKLVYGLNYKLGNKEAVDAEGKAVTIRAQVQKLEDDIVAKYGDVGEQLIKRLIKWTPELSGTEYEKLDSADAVETDVRNMIDEILTIEPASPTLAFEEPKGE